MRTIRLSILLVAGSLVSVAANAQQSTTAAPAQPAAAASPADNSPEARDIETFVKQAEYRSAALAGGSAAPSVCVKDKFVDDCAPLTEKERQIVIASAKKRVTTQQGVKFFDDGKTLKVAFLLGSAELTEAAKGQLDLWAKALTRGAQKARWYIAGHTDALGSLDSNMSLSERRAQSVRDYLVSRGVDQSRLDARGLGPKYPLPGTAPTDPRNRRVVLSQIAVDAKP